jgi:hypothetical protein
MIYAKKYYIITTNNNMKYEKLIIALINYNKLKQINKSLRNKTKQNKTKSQQKD